MIHPSSSCKQPLIAGWSGSFSEGLWCSSTVLHLHCFGCVPTAADSSSDSAAKCRPWCHQKLMECCAKLVCLRFEGRVTPFEQLEFLSDRERDKQGKHVAACGGGTGTRINTWAGRVWADGSAWAVEMHDGFVLMCMTGVWKCHPSVGYLASAPPGLMEIARKSSWLPFAVPGLPICTAPAAIGTVIGKAKCTLLKYIIF